MGCRKRGQAALEFIMSYGWALIAFILVVGSLWFFLGGSNYFISENCMMGPGFWCNDFEVYETSISFRVTNAQGKSLEDFYIIDPACFSQSQILSLKSQESKIFTVEDCNLEYGEPYESYPTMSYKFAGSTIDHSRGFHFLGIVSGGIGVNLESGGGVNTYEIIANRRYCSEKYYVLENEKIKLFVTTPTIKDSNSSPAYTISDCSWGVYNENQNRFAGIPSKMWTKDNSSLISDSPNYKKDSTLLDNFQFQTGLNTLRADDISYFIETPTGLDINYPIYSNLRPKISYFSNNDWNYVRVTLAVENVGSTDVQNVQLRFSGDIDGAGKWRNDEGETRNGGSTSLFDSLRWLAIWHSSRNDIFGIVSPSDGSIINITNDWDAFEIEDIDSITLSQGEIHSLVFYYVSDFKGPSGNEWQAIEDVYNLVS